MNVVLRNGLLQHVTYETAYTYLLGLPRFAAQGQASVQWGFERMEALMDAMGQPHHQFKSIHIAGTNGKGSTASMLASIASASGYRVGLHTSPHLWYVGERMRVNGNPASKAWISEAVDRYRSVFEQVQPSFFEATVALSFLFFAESAVDYAVVEVGLGGRLDATNILQPALTMITNIGLDHTALLGDTHAAIAREKAGIVKPHVPLLTATTRPDVNAVFQDITEQNQAPWHQLPSDVKTDVLETHLRSLTLHIETPKRRYAGLDVGLTGAHQHNNAALATRAAELLFSEVQKSAEPVYRGLREVKQRSGMRGRLDVIQQTPLILADVAHNTESLSATLDFAHTEAEARGGRLVVAFGVMQDKALADMIALLEDKAAYVWPLALESERAIDVGALRDLLTKQGIALLSGGHVQGVWEWFTKHATENDVLLITGSHQVLSQF